jgi:GDP-4-dehydro-6-deoxy-D-mannose reductase
MKVLITGASGFVGPYLRRAMERQGHQLLGLDRTGHSNNTVKADILDLAQLKKVFNDFKPAAIAHLAGFSSVQDSWDKPELVRSINVDGTKNILEAAVSTGLKPRVLIVSSAEVYGEPKKLPMTESHPLQPGNPYAQSRVKQEELALSYDLPIIIARSFNHTGPGQRPIAVLSIFAKQIAEIEAGQADNTFTVGNIEVRRDFTDVRDVVMAYSVIIEKGKPREIYNICSGNSYSIKYLLDELISLATKDIQYAVDKSKFRPTDITELKGDYSKINKELGWQPQIPIKITLADLLNFWRDNV